MGDCGGNNVLGEPIFQFRISYNSPQHAATITPDGNFQIIGSFISSDQRLKTNIKTLDNCLYKILNLRGVQYTRIQSGRREIRMLSQEVEYLIPELVEENDDNLKYLHYVGLVPMLIESIKEMNQIILNQNNLINNLINRIEILENK